MGPKVYIITLGCPKNEVDSFEFEAHLKNLGARVLDDPSKAQIIIINSCSFIREARLETQAEVEYMLSFKKQKPSLKIYLMGCWVEMSGLELLRKFPDIDGLLGNRDLKKTAESILAEFAATTPLISIPRSYVSDPYFCRLPPTFPYAYIKIAEGCSNHCSYCRIPQIRGPFRSYPADRIKSYARHLIDQGYKELILIAQETTNYGSDLYPTCDLASLIEDIAALRGDFWIRLLYGHPKSLDDKLLMTILNTEKVVPYLDLPLQHISDRILTQMNRKVNSRQIRFLLGKLKEKNPDFALRSTFMVGFPGESDREFDELVRLIEEGYFDHLGFFEFSAEENTPAYNLSPRIPEEIARNRKEILEIIQGDIILHKNQKLVGRKVPMLVEGKAPGVKRWTARTIWDAPQIDRIVELQGKSQIGRIVEATIVEAEQYEFKGII
ncbi:30S ribosomal protein S12 methylthiotransferase RimO [bacterium]|nr:30S ribosomal protein S12 methylthiotransferase RimO [bacterium]